MKLKITPIRYVGQEMSIVCDARCDKAWGTVDRPSVQLDDEDEDDFAWLADHELGTAPDTSSTSEGSDVKPVTIGELRHNKWCARSCERSSLPRPGAVFELKTFERRFYNIPSSDPENNA